MIQFTVGNFDQPKISGITVTGSTSGGGGGGTPTPTPKATPTPTAVSGGSCSGVGSITTGGKTYNPSWCQEFNGAAGPPDTSVWKFALGNNGGWGNGEVEVYCGPPGYAGNPSQCPTSFSTSTSPVYIDGNGHLAIHPINVGGRPLHSWPAFIVVTFEMTILFAGLAAVLGMLALNGLPMPYHPVFNVPRFAFATKDRFFLIVFSTDPKYSPSETRRFLETLEPRSISEVPS